MNAAGEIYLLGRDGATIFRFGRSSEPLGSFPVAGASGNGPSELSRLLVDGVGRIHGQTPDDGMVVAYDASGRLLAMTPSAGRLCGVTPEGRLFGARGNWWEPIELQGGQFVAPRVACAPGDMRALYRPVVIGLNGRVYAGESIGDHVFYEFTPDMKLISRLRRLEDPTEFQWCADALGFRYGSSVAADVAGFAAPAPGQIASQDALDPVFVGAFEPCTGRFFGFWVWHAPWGKVRLGLDGNVYTLAYNSLPWGKWQGTRIYRHLVWQVHPGR